MRRVRSHCSAPIEPQPRAAIPDKSDCLDYVSKDQIGSPTSRTLITILRSIADLSIDQQASSLHQMSNRSSGP